MARSRAGRRDDHARHRAGRVGGLRERDGAQPLRIGLSAPRDARRGHDPGRRGRRRILAAALGATRAAVGLQLMRALMSSVEVEPGPHGTRVTLERRLLVPEHEPRYNR